MGFWIKGILLMLAVELSNFAFADESSKDNSATPKQTAQPSGQKAANPLSTWEREVLSSLELLENLEVLEQMDLVTDLPFLKENGGDK